MDLSPNEMNITGKKVLLKFLRELHPYECPVGLIRVGPDADGGYLLPNDLEGLEACFSPGVGEISGFESQCIEMGMDVYMADGSVENPGIDLKSTKYDFIQKFVGCYNDEETITMDSWVSRSKANSDSDLLLQMDIEGAEFSVISHMSESLLKRFRIMVIEIHNLDGLWAFPFYQIARETFRKIFKTHHCIHIHPNNCCGVYSQHGIDIPRMAEFTFYRKDRGTFDKYASIYPHPLDQENTSNEPLVLPKVWYRSS